ncbi:MAG: hypothetical protein K0R98_1319 [Rickettsiaceae bacterium]|jgi:hypothetical protein|nr:hypothetical protein [Rickettsiaceae bacterium]
MNKSISSALIISTLLVLANCASVTGPGRQQVKINSEPSGAEVKVDGRTVTTPAVVELKGQSQYYLTASKPGYKDSSEVLGSEVRILASVVGNMFNFTSLVGMAVDFFGTGAAYNLDDEVNIKMKKS